MIARLSSAGLAFLLLVGSAAAQELPQTVTLLRNVVVNDDVVRLGDIFDNIGGKSEIAVAYAPRYGGRTVLDSTWLSQAARVYQLRWRSGSRFDRVVVERASQTVDKSQIESALVDALADSGREGKLQIDLDNRTLALFLPPEATPTVAVKNLRLNDRAGRFSATIAAPANQPVVEKTIHGKFFTVVSIPVLARRVSREDVVSEDDIVWMDVASKRIQCDVITEATQLVGMAPRRFLRPRAPVRVSDVRRPVLVSKGSAVTMIMRTPLMMLTARGKAIESGSKGDLIRVMNTQSRKVIDALVVDGNTVAVRNVGPVAAR